MQQTLPVPARTSAPVDFSLPRDAVTGEAIDVLAEVYREHINLCVWRRTPDPRIEQYLGRLLQPRYVGVTWQYQCAAHELRDLLLTVWPVADHRDVLIDDLQLLVDLFATLLDLDRVGLRVSVLGKAMCPRFHVDRVPCRLVTTYGGPGTEWLRNADVNRGVMGRRSPGQPDEVSGLIASPDRIQRLGRHDVALMKGENWQGNDGGGLVHRSPALSEGEMRLVVTLDIIG